MIREFKTKEQLKKEKIYEEANYFEGLARERFIRLMMDEPQENDRLFISNFLIKTKFLLSQNLKLSSQYRVNLKETKDLIMLVRDKSDLNKLKDYEKALLDAIDTLDEIKINRGAILVNHLLLMIDKYFNEHEIIQLVGGSEYKAKEIKNAIEDIGSRHLEGGLAFNFIFHHGEYKWRKGRAKEFIDCPEWEMPLFFTISDYILKEIKSNPELKSGMDNLFQEMFEDTIAYPKYDSQGNIVSLDKAIQEIGIKELMTNYKDLEPSGIITRLKKQSILDINTAFKLKREQGDLTIKYKVMDLDGNDLGYVFKL